MKASLLNTVATLEAWLQMNSVDPKDLTLILNFKSEREGARIDAAVQKEFYQGFLNASRQMASRFKLMGIDIKIESPFHEH